MRDNSAMHLLIPYAAPLGLRCQSAISQLQLPYLAALLQRLTRTQEHHGHPHDLTPLHEKLELTLTGGTMQDGLTAQAAHAAIERGLALPNEQETSRGWAWITPCHWQIHSDHVHMADPLNLQLSQEESLALLQAMQGYFAEDGITLHPYSASTWLAQGNVLCDLPTASPERVVGNSVDAWINRQPQAKPLRRLQNEMQMLLYTHPLNDARTERGLPVVNSFWVSGTGTPDVKPIDTKPVLCNKSLKTSALQDDATRWIAAWQQLDRQVSDMFAGLADDTIQLTLCGQDKAHTYSYLPQPWWKHLTRRLSKASLATYLQQLQPQE